MTTKSKTERIGKIEIDITGPQGNAYCLLGYARQYGKQIGIDVKAVQTEMTSGNYENLLNVFDKYFGEYIDLLR